MANLIETAIWEPGIYQFEEEDLVQGGPDGVDNRPTKQLGNRTLFLKQLIEAAQNDMAAHLAAADPHTQYATELWVAAQIAALVNSSPAALDTLNELAIALGNDANFATTMTNALALKASLASFSGLLGSNGYQPLPGGCVFQWGTNACSAGADASVTLPTTFGSAIYTVVGIADYTVGSGQVVKAAASATSKSIITLRHDAAGAINIHWFAVGKA